MIPDPQQAKAIFLAALEHAGDKRSAFLDEACAGAPELRARVEQLLEAHERPDSLVAPDSGPQGTVDSHPEVGETAAAPVGISETPGTVIGPYKLLEQIGEGGMGTVWMAEQHQPIRRRVALKVIKPGMDSKQVLGRFEAERQALALMDHPNIARVLDAGTTPAGRPYFVMELVKGVSLTKYCDDKRLPPRERLELFVSVCQAVQHAHQKGIIHRDLKPSNVLVAPYDGRPVVKVIDFGVAKATGQQLTERTLFTGFGAVVGTLEYMSPEQAELNNNDIDTRSDIYSLGVLLYELLTGSTPLTRKQCKEAALLEVLRLVREQESAKPSTRLSSTDELPAIAANRGLEPKKLSNLVRGELDWIVMKALEKDRSRRYETANGFAMDLQRYLADEPVQACPPSAMYRVGKFVRRNRTALTTASLLTLALICGTIVSIWQAIRATRAEATAKEEFARAEANHRKARKAVDDYFTLVSESTLLDVPGLQPLRKSLLETALQYYQGMLEQRADDPVLLADVAVAYLRMGKVYHETNRNDDAIGAFESALEVVEQLRDKHPHAREQHRAIAGFWKVSRGIGPNTVSPSDTRTAMRTLTRFLKLWEAFAAENSSVEEFQDDLACINHWLAGVEGGRGFAGEMAAHTRALEFAHKAIAIWERLSQKHPETRSYREKLAHIYGDLAWNLGRTGQKKEAHAALDRVRTLFEQLAAQHPDVPTYRQGLAASLTSLGDREAQAGRAREAEAAYLRSFDILADLINQFPGAAGYGNTQARNLQRLLGLANHLGPRTLDMFTKALEKQPTHAYLWHARGDTFLALKQPEKALSDFSKAIELAPSADPHWYGGRANLYQMLKQNDKALADLSRAIELWPKLWEAWVWRAWFHVSQQQWEKSVVDYSKVLELNPIYWSAWHGRGSAHAKLKQWDKALADYSKVLELNSNQDAASHLAAAIADFAASGRSAEADLLLRRAMSHYQKLTTELPNEKVHPRGLAEIHGVEARLFQTAGKTPAAEDAYRRALAVAEKLAAGDAAEPVDRDRLARTHFNLGGVQQQIGQMDEAEKNYRQAIAVWTRLASDLPMEHVYRSYADHAMSRYLTPLLQANGRTKEAELALRSAIATWEKLATDQLSNPNDHTTLIENYGVLSNLLVTAGRHREAEQICTKAIEKWPNSANFYVSRAEVSMALQKPDQAIVDFTTALELAPHGGDTPWWYFGRAGAYLGLKQDDKALRDLEKAIEIRPELWDVWVWRGNFHFSQQDWHKAIADFTKAQDLKAPYWPAWHSRGAAFAKLQQWDKAILDFGKAVEMNPNADAHNDLAWLLATCPDAKLRQAARAVAAAKKAVELAPQAGYLWSTLGVAQYRAGDWKAASEALTKSMKLSNGGGSVPRFFLAMAHWKLDQKKEARKWYDQAVLWMEKNAPQHEELRRFRAEAAELLGIKIKESK